MKVRESLACPASVANPGGTNLVLYTEALQEGDRLMAYDPTDDLPKDQRSWE